MKRKIITGVVAFLVILPVVALSVNDDRNVKNTTIEISQPVFEDKGNYILAKIPEASSFTMEEGKPMLPVIVKTFTFPVGTKIEGVDVEMNIKEYTLQKKIAPAPSPVLLDGKLHEVEMKMDASVYNSQQKYPERAYEVRKGIGLNEGQRVVFVNVRCYTQYSPSINKLYVPQKINIKIEYDLPEKDIFSASTYDMLIVTDEKFLSQMQELADFKNSTGIKTTVMTTQYIYANYDGRDEPEKIKYAIKDAIEKWGIKYVLLGGGRKGQTFDWYVPERRSNNDADFESGYASDLYYADVYKYVHGNPVFEDWDSNGNGVFAEYSKWGERRDVMDYYPDVYVGRLPFRYTWEADVVVDKIKQYEQSGGSWFYHAFLAGGDTSPPARDTAGVIKRGVYEGEIVCDVVADYLSHAGFQIDKLYTSLGTFNNYEDIVNAFMKGNGFAYFSGHGNPGVWGNFWPDGETEEEFSLGFTVFDIWKYNNGIELPVVVVGGCHNAQFNVTMQYLMPYNEDAVMHGEYYPHDGCSWMLLEEGGGSIASIGYTGYGYGYINEYCTMGLGGWIEPRFFYEYAMRGLRQLGDIHSQAIVDYINIIDAVNTDQIDRKTIESWVLLGDPSLRIGGIGATAGNGGGNENDGSQTAFYNDVPVWEKGMKWRYSVSDFDFSLHEVEGRNLDIHLSPKEIELEVTDVTSSSYIAKLTIPDADVNLNVDLDLSVGNPIKMSAHLASINVVANVEIDKTNMGLKNVDATITTNLDVGSLNLSLPPIIERIFDIIPFVININLNAEFDHPYVIIDFPLDMEKSWGIPPANLTIDGTITSMWFRIIKIINAITSIFGMPLIPPELAQLLPVIRIPQLLAMLNMSNPITIPKIWDPLYHDIHPFLCKSEKTINVQAGSFRATQITMVRGIGEIYYADDAENVVDIKANFHDILYTINDFEIELVEMSK